MGNKKGGTQCLQITQLKEKHCPVLLKKSLILPGFSTGYFTLHNNFLHHSIISSKFFYTIFILQFRELRPSHSQIAQNN